jgi:hypothetical protein
MTEKQKAIASLSTAFIGLPDALAREIQDECKYKGCPDGVAFVQLKLDAVWDAAIEAAAKVALNEKVDAESTGDKGDAAYNLALEHAAKAIRELKKG